MQLASKAAGSLTVVVAAAFLLAGPAQAQQQDQNQADTAQDQAQQTEQDQTQRRTAERELENSLEDWDYQPLYEDGWQADAFLDNDVFGEAGEEIGTVENFLLDRQGQIVAVVAEVGGFLDISDTHVAVPWSEVDLRNGDVHTPLSDENAEDYSLFADEFFTQVDVGDLQRVEDELTTGFDIWKVTNLLDDYAVLESGLGYGYVDDLIFDRQGQLQSVVVSASGEYGEPGSYAFPWYGYGYDGYAWAPGLDYYTLPFDDADEFADLEPFDSDQMEPGVI